MPRTARAIEGGLIYHVMNRGNGRMRLFHKPADYDAFERVLAAALEKFPSVELLAYCLMPNHWHLVPRPAESKDLARFMSWLCVTHVRRHHEHYHGRGGGHLYQGRFKSFPVQGDEHLLTLLRYVEANALRAKLVDRAERWRWCSLRIRREGGSGRGKAKITLCSWPVDEPRNWLRLVNEAMETKQLKQLRESVQRGRPWGDARWVEKMAARLGLTFTLRGPGRPKKVQNRGNQ